MTRRFFVDAPIHGETAVLVGHEAHHLSNVLRGKAGDTVVLFDGSGAEFTAAITAVQRSTVELRVVERSEVNRELAFALTVGAALPKGDRQRWLVEKLVELGVTNLVPLITERGVAQPNANAIERLRRAVIEASKQCGRNRLMRIRAPRKFDEYVAEAAHESLNLLAHPTSQTDLHGWLTESSHGGDICVAIGPEGGFTDDEVARVAAPRWHRISLGPRVLRTETAAVAISSLIVLR